MSRRKKDKNQLPKNGAEAPVAAADSQDSAAPGSELASQMLETVADEIEATPDLETPPAMRGIEAQVEAPAVTEEPVHSLEYAAKHLINDVRSWWLSGIRSRAKLQGVDPESHQTLETWRQIFVAWGGHGILK
jgi:hypothetical protein